jgi:hypothetical protein
LDGSLERLINPDEYLKRKIPESVERGDFGLASGEQATGGYQRVWFNESISPDEVSFDADVYLLKKEKARLLVAGSPVPEVPLRPPASIAEEPPRPSPTESVAVGAGTTRIVLSGAIPPELWNKVGIRLIPKLRSNAQPTLEVNFALELDSAQARNLISEIKQALADLDLTEKIKIQIS